MPPCPRTFPLFATALALAIGMSLDPAAAQQACGGSYTIRAGDTLSAIAKRCGIALPDVMASNPGIEPRRLEIGQVITLPGAPETAEAPTPPTPSEPTPEPAVTPRPEPSTGQTPPTPPSAAEWGMERVDDQPTDDGTPPGANYIVRAGDSLTEIAARFDTSVTELVKTNPQLIRQKELIQGQRLLVPGVGPNPVALAPDQDTGVPWTAPQYSLGAAVEVLPRRVAVGDSVTIYARGLPVRTNVEIAAGDPDGRMVVVDRETTDHYGTVRARVALPRNLPPDAPLNIVIATRDRAFGARSGALEVRPAGTSTAARAGERVEVTGTLTTEGLLCPAIRTGDGILYTLSGDIARLVPGDRVRVVGLIAGTSQCNQGITISAARIEMAEPNQAEQ
ncbi:MAG: LysM peptidoglycan-binding domain-containing protein [Rhodospirillaceae bacterium]